MKTTVYPKITSKKYMKVIVEITMYTVIGLLLGSIFFRQVIFSNFDLLLGDAGDACFNGVILEHWWQVVHGNAQWLSPNFFFPTQGTLGYSDVGFLNAIPYIVLRFAGLGTFTSYQIVLFALVALGWVGSILFLRLCLKLSMVPTLIGTILFVFPNAMANSLGHTQLLTVYLIPYLAIAIYFFLPNIKKSTFRGSAAGFFLAVFVPAIFYTSYYIGWFFVFFILLLSGIFCILSIMSLGTNIVWNRIIWKWDNVRFFWPYGIICSICFIPFLLTYIPTALEFGPRSYQEISLMLPSFIDYINIGPNNWLWGNILYSVFPSTSSRPMAHELIKGIPFFLFLTYWAVLLFYVGKIKNYKLTMFQNNNCKIITTGNEAAESRILTILAAGLSIAILLTWFLMLKIHGISLWWLISKVIPGAGGIRAVYRFQHVLAFPLGIVIAISLHQFINYTKSHKYSYLKQGLLTVLLLLLVIEQFNTASIANYSKQQQNDMLAAINPPPPQARVFALLPRKKFTLPYKAQVYAMLIAQKYGLYTINGYSGQLPRGWHEIYYYNRPTYMLSLARWIKRHNLMTNQLYFLNMDTGQWHPAANWEIAE